MDIQDQLYLGYTSHTLPKRILKHKYDIEKEKTTNALAQKALNSNLQINWESTKNIKRQKNPHIKQEEFLAILKKKKQPIKPINIVDLGELKSAWKFYLNSLLKIFILKICINVYNNNLI